MEKRRVVVTGLGLSLQMDRRKGVLDSLVLGRSGIKTVIQFDTSSYPCSVAGEVEDSTLRPPLTPECKEDGRFSQFGVACSKWP